MSAGKALEEPLFASRCLIFNHLRGSVGRVVRDLGDALVRCRLQVLLG
jgi:hypothetical protein